MHTLGLAKLGNTSTLMPKHCLSQSFVKFETLAKNQNIENVKFETCFKQPVKPQFKCELPLGTKRASFMSRDRPVKQQKIRSQTFLKQNQFDISTHLMFENHNPTMDIFQPIKTNPINECHPPTPDSPLTQSTSPASSNLPNPPNNHGPNLEMVAYQLTQDLTNIFMQRQEWSMYHKEVVLQDNIRGECKDNH
jgi:hypothetical protein